MPSLPIDRTARKHMPIGTGCLDYFPDALGAVAHCSYVATQQHHAPGSPMHWDKSKSTDEADCLIRHFLERGTLDTDGVRHSAKVAWRALALLQREIEAEKAGDSSCNSNHPAPDFKRCINCVCHGRTIDDCFMRGQCMRQEPLVTVDRVLGSDDAAFIETKHR